MQLWKQNIFNVCQVFGNGLDQRFAGCIDFCLGNGRQSGSIIIRRQKIKVKRLWPATRKRPTHTHIRTRELARTLLTRSWRHGYILGITQINRMTYSHETCIRVKKCYTNSSSLLTAIADLWILHHHYIIKSLLIFPLDQKTGIFNFVIKVNRFTDFCTELLS